MLPASGYPIPFDAFNYSVVADYFIFCSDKRYMDELDRQEV